MDEKRIEGELEPLKCVVAVTGGIDEEMPIDELRREWTFTEKDFNGSTDYIDGTGAAMNYAMSMMNPKVANWVRFEWTWL